MSKQQHQATSPLFANSQQAIASRFWIGTLSAAIMTSCVFIDGTVLSGIWALGLIGIFLTVSAGVCGMIFTRRAKKMDQLISGAKVLAGWEMDEQMLKEYAMLHNAESRTKNDAIMTLVTILFVVITLPFLFFLESDERLGFALIMAGVLAIVFLASRFFPMYYRRQNLRGDRRILLGPKYAYLNGYLHNWDFPLSGLKEVKIITTPFYGLQLVYYTTDRTFKHDHVLKIPAPRNTDLQKVIVALRSAN